MLGSHATFIKLDSRVLICGSAGEVCIATPRDVLVLRVPGIDVLQQTLQPGLSAGVWLQELLDGVKETSRKAVILYLGQLRRAGALIPSERRLHDELHRYNRTAAFLDSLVHVAHGPCGVQGNVVVIDSITSICRVLTHLLDRRAGLCGVCLILVKKGEGSAAQISVCRGVLAEQLRYRSFKISVNICDQGAMQCVYNDSLGSAEALGRCLLSMRVFQYHDVITEKWCYMLDKSTDVQTVWLIASCPEAKTVLLQLAVRKLMGSSTDISSEPRQLTDHATSTILDIASPILSEILRYPDLRDLLANDVFADVPTIILVEV